MVWLIFKLGRSGPRQQETHISLSSLYLIAFSIDPVTDWHRLVLDHE